VPQAVQRAEPRFLSLFFASEGYLSGDPGNGPKVKYI
jgi:hypothetical protein